MNKSLYGLPAPELDDYRLDRRTIAIDDAPKAMLLAGWASFSKYPEAVHIPTVQYPLVDGTYFEIRVDRSFNLEKVSIDFLPSPIDYGLLNEYKQVEGKNNDEGVWTVLPDMCYSVYDSYKEDLYELTFPEMSIKKDNYRVKIRSSLTALNLSNMATVALEHGRPDDAVIVVGNPSNMAMRVMCIPHAGTTGERTWSVVIPANDEYLRSIANPVNGLGYIEQFEESYPIIAAAGHPYSYYNSMYNNPPFWYLRGVAIATLVSYGNNNKPVNQKVQYSFGVGEISIPEIDSIEAVIYDDFELVWFRDLPNVLFKLSDSTEKNISTNIDNVLTDTGLVVSGASTECITPVWSNSSIKVGSYTGSGTTTQTSVYLGFTPTLVVICRVAPDFNTYVLSEVLVCDGSLESMTDVAMRTLRFDTEVIAELHLDGFTLGQSFYFNAAATYYYIAYR